MKKNVFYSIGLRDIIGFAPSELYFFFKEVFYWH